MNLGRNDIALLSLLATPKVGNARASKVLAWCASRGRELADFTAKPEAIKGVLSEEMATWLGAEHPEVLRTAQELEAKQISMLRRGEALYPQRLSELLGDKAPVALFAKGNLKLLDSLGVGFCGSR